MPWYQRITAVYSAYFCKLLLLLLLFPPAGDIHILLKQLVLFDYNEQAGVLHQVLEEVLQLMETSIPEIWTADLQQSSVNQVCAHLQYPSLFSNILHSLAKSLESFSLDFHICFFLQRSNRYSLQHLPSQYALDVHNRNSLMCPLSWMPDWTWWGVIWLVLPCHSGDFFL